MIVSVTKADRRVESLHPVAQKACRLFLDECKRQGVNIFITETYRSQERQKWLYAQGRTRPGKIVTWTLNSNHKSKLAWDIAVSPPQSLYDVATLNKAGVIARKLGIEWGGDWKGTIDRPHFQVKTSWRAPATDSVKDLQRLLNKHGFNLVVDGREGALTTNAIKEFQKREGLTADGIAGDKTIAALKKEKEVDEMSQQLPKTQKDDMRNLLTKAYNTRDNKGNRVFSVDHTPKVDNMTRGQAVDLLISYTARTS